MQVREIEPPPRRSSSVAEKLDGELEVLVVPSLDVFTGNAGAFGNEYAVGYGAGGVIWNERKGAYAGHVLENGQRMQPS